MTEVKSKNYKFPVEMPLRNIDNFDLISNDIENNDDRRVALYINKIILKLRLLHFRYNFVKMYGQK